MATIDTTDTERAFCRHLSGDLYIYEYASEWDENDRCVGTRVIAVCGPILQSEINHPKGDFDLDGGDAEWLQAEMDAGRIFEVAS